jgi:hypothetical protein
MIFGKLKIKQQADIPCPDQKSGDPGLEHYSSCTKVASFVVLIYSSLPNREERGA